VLENPIALALLEKSNHSSWIQRQTAKIMVMRLSFKAIPGYSKRIRPPGPIRAIRSSSADSVFAPPSGFGYDGLYNIAYGEHASENAKGVFVSLA
jgi:hypothetical protein